MTIAEKYMVKRPSLCTKSSENIAMISFILVNRAARCGCSCARTGLTGTVRMYKESQLILAVRWYFCLNCTRDDSLFLSMQVAPLHSMIISYSYCSSSDQSTHDHNQALRERHCSKAGTSNKQQKR